MAIDYKKELETAAKNMILVHEPDTLIKMIVRLIVQKVRVLHAGLLLHDEYRNTYALRVSRGRKVIEIPKEFICLDIYNPLIHFFRHRKDKEILGDGLIVYQQAKQFLRKKINQKTKDIIKAVLHQMDVLEAVVCIPSYFRDDLLGVMLLGKKKNGREFHRRELDFFVALASDVAMAIHNARLFKQIQGELDKRRELFINTTIALATAIEAKDHYTSGHTQQVINLSLKIGKKLLEKENMHLGNKFLEDLHIAALLHDIGKIGIPESILNKDGPLNEKERQRIKLHPVIGASILQPIKELEPVIQGVRHHHERYDGKGYPDGLDDGRIPIIAAIIAVADTFNAITTNRPYRKAMSRQEAISEIKSASGEKFYPQVVSVFLKLCEEGQI
jgi:HD-GYP domain-containing protein (c-di-GMP phosphodiesterase class II)